jgi:protein PhnA
MEINDANGSQINIGDTVHLIKDLNVKGLSKGLKRDTNFVVRDLTMDDEAVEVKLGKSTIGLKPEYVKKG